MAADATWERRLQAAWCAGLQPGAERPEGRSTEPPEGGAPQDAMPDCDHASARDGHFRKSAMAARIAAWSWMTGNCGKSFTTAAEGRNSTPQSAAPSIEVSL